MAEGGQLLALPCLHHITRFVYRFLPDHPLRSLDGSLPQIPPPLYLFANGRVIQAVRWTRKSVANLHTCA